MGFPRALRCRECMAHVASSDAAERIEVRGLIQGVGARWSMANKPEDSASVVGYPTVTSLPLHSTGKPGGE